MDFSHISSYLSSDSRSGWREKLLEASFRGVPFKVEEESAGTGRRVETHEYPNRDKPYTEDLGKVTFRPSITAYVVGDDCFDQRDRLIDALNKPGPGTLVHPTYGELKVCVDGEVRVSTSKSEGRIVRFDLKFVEAGELSYPTSGAATAQTLMSSCSALDDCISDSFSGFSIDGVADFVQNDVIGNIEYMKASIRARVEHPFRIIKRQFGFVKARYKGLLKNDNQLAMLFTLANLFRVDQMIRQGRDLSKNRK